MKKIDCLVLKTEQKNRISYRNDEKIKIFLLDKYGKEV